MSMLKGCRVTPFTAARFVWVTVVLAVCLVAPKAGAEPVAAGDGKPTVSISGTKRWELSAGWFRQLTASSPSGESGPGMLSPTGLNFLQSLELTAEGGFNDYQFQAHWTDVGALADNLSLDLNSPRFQAHMGQIGNGSGWDALLRQSGFISSGPLTGVELQWTHEMGEVQALLAKPLYASAREEILLLPGVSTVELSQAAVEPGSEEVYAFGRSLLPFADYDIDYERGRVHLHWTSPESVRLVVSYRYARGEFQRAGRVQAAAATQSLGRGWAIAATYLHAPQLGKSYLGRTEPSMEAGSLGLQWRSVDGRWNLSLAQDVASRTFPSETIIEDFAAWDEQKPILPPYWLSNWKTSASPGSTVVVSAGQESGRFDIDYSLAPGTNGECEYRFASAVDLQGLTEVVFQGTNSGRDVEVEVELLAEGGTFLKWDRIPSGSFIKTWPIGEWVAIGNPTLGKIIGVAVSIHNGSGAENAGRLSVERLDWVSPGGDEERWWIVAGEGSLQVVTAGEPNSEDVRQVLQVRVTRPGDITLERIFPTIHSFTSYRSLSVLIRSDDWDGNATLEVLTLTGSVQASKKVNAGGWNRLNFPMEEFVNKGLPENWPETQDSWSSVRGLRLTFENVSETANVYLSTILLADPLAALSTKKRLAASYAGPSGGSIGGRAILAADFTETGVRAGTTLPGKLGRLSLDLSSRYAGEEIQQGLALKHRWEPPGSPWRLAASYQSSRSSSGSLSQITGITAGYQTGRWTLSSHLHASSGQIAAAGKPFRAGTEVAGGYKTGEFGVYVKAAGVLDLDRLLPEKITAELRTDWRPSRQDSLHALYTINNRTWGAKESSYKTGWIHRFSSRHNVELTLSGRVAAPEVGVDLTQTHTQRVEVAFQDAISTWAVGFEHHFASDPRGHEGDTEKYAATVRNTPGRLDGLSWYGELGVAVDDKGSLPYGEIGGVKGLATRWGKVVIRSSILHHHTWQADIETSTGGPIYKGFEWENSTRLYWNGVGLGAHLRSGLIWRF